jgi:hypothetical protein
MSTTGSAGNEGRPSDLHGLWAEALWGVGLMATVLIAVALIAAIFGR